MCMVDRMNTEYLHFGMSSSEYFAAICLQRVSVSA